MNSQDVKQIFDQDFAQLSEKEQDWLRKILVFPYEAEVPTDIENENLTKVFIVAEGVEITTGAVCIIYDSEAEAYGRVMTLGNQYLGPIGSLSESIPEAFEQEPVKMIVSEEKKVVTKAWPLVATAWLLLVWPSCMLILFLGGMIFLAIQDSKKLSESGLSPIHVLIGLVLFILPIRAGWKYLRKKEGANGILSYASMIMTLFIIMPIVLLAKNMDPEAVKWTVCLSLIGGGFLFHKLLKSYCFGKTEQVAVRQ
jgi:hypothetical protein